jgi:hypothetical protein
MDHCQHCNKGFATRSSLKRHIHAKHPNELGGSKKESMVHSCPHCHQSFTRSESLRRHILNKHGRGPSLCSICMAQHRADYMSQHRSICAKRYSKWLQQHNDLDDTAGIVTSRSGPRSLQRGIYVWREKDTQQSNNDDPSRSQRGDQPLRIVYEHIFDARLTGDALTCALMTFEETDDIDAYNQTLTAAFRLNITFNCQGTRPSKKGVRFFVWPNLH